MTSRAAVEEFIGIKDLAIVGVSRKGGKFGNIIYKELKKKGYNTFGVNPKLDTIDGDKCYSSLKELEGKVHGVVNVVSPTQTKSVVEEANAIGLKNIWMQQGSESKEAIEYCKENGMNEIHKECILMFAEPVKSIHGFHRWIWKILGKLPN
ncbi:MAG: CoA-binding protein [Melioribacteraceae bacterium]|nr:CoA-binding protein [Melioribacteraceae bacterium]